MPRGKGAEELLVAVDLGTNKVCVVVAEMGIGSTPQVVGVGSVPSRGIKKGVIVNMEEATNCVRQACEEARRMSNCSFDRVLLTSSALDVGCVFNRGMISLGKDARRVTQDDVKRVVEVAGSVPIPTDRFLVHVLPKEFLVDGQGGIDNPLGMSAVRLEVEVQVITALASSVKNVISAVEGAGLSVEGFLLKPVASAYAVLGHQERYLGTAVVDVGAGTTGVAVFHQGTLRYVSLVPLGGDHITNDIACVLRVPLPSAEELKVRWAVAHQDFVDEDAEIEISMPGSRKSRVVTRRELSEIVSFRLEEIMGMVSEEISKSGVDMLPGGVVVTGGCAMLPYVDEFASELLGVSVRVGYPVGVGGLSDILMQPVYSSAVGLLKASVEVPEALVLGGGGLGSSPRRQVQANRGPSAWSRLKDFVLSILRDFF